MAQTSTVMPPAEAPVAVPPPKLLLVAGESSADAHGAELIHALKLQHPGIRIIGVGGPKMAAAGQDQLFDLSAHAVLGLTEVLKHYLKFRGFLDRIVKLGRTERPDAVVLIDCSGFNLRLAPRLKQSVPGARVIYYISPQVWASRAGRVRVMSRTIDLLLSILPFERDWFARAAPGFKVQWVGHPALDRLQKVEGAIPNPDWVALLPGSRKAEITAHLPELWATARLMARERKGLKFVLLSPNEEIQAYSLELVEKYAPANFDFEYNVGYAVSHLSRCSLALVASGTASMECALVGLPQVVIYKVHPLTYAIARRVIKVRHLSIINVMANEEIVPEFIQDKLQPEAVAQAALELLGNASRREEMKRNVARIVASLGGPGASQRAAEAILQEVAKAKAL